MLLTFKLEQATDRIGDVLKDKITKLSVYAQPEILSFHTKNLSTFLGIINDNSSLKEVFDVRSSSPPSSPPPLTPSRSWTRCSSP